MQTPKEQTPRQGLPDEGSAVASGLLTPKSDGAGTPRENPMATRQRSNPKAPVSHIDTISFALNAAMEVVNDETLDELDWPVVLKAKVQDCPTPFRDSDLLRYLRQAKLNRDGRKDFVDGRSALKIRRDEWLWRGVIMREATNIIFALPKVGKTRLMLAMLAAFLRGRGEFAGIALHPGKEKLLILGPDQSESSWGSYLQKADLCDDKGFLAEKVVAMTTAETMFQIDHYWLTKVEEVLRAHGPLVVLLDSYSAAIRGLGLDENRSEAATPLMQLHNLIHQYDSTLIVIHHANKAGGDGNAARASRGSSAITAAADNLVEMTSFKQSTEEGGPKKYELRVEGRAESDGVPLVGFSKHSNEWISCGSVSELRAETQKDQQYDALAAGQLMVLNALVESTLDRNQAMTAKEVAEAVYTDPSKSQKVMVHKTLGRLVDLGFACLADTGKESKLKHFFYSYLATAWACKKHRIDF